MNVGLCHWITCFLGCVITGIAIVCDSSYCVLLDSGMVFFFFFFFYYQLKCMIFVFICNSLLYCSKSRDFNLGRLRDQGCSDNLSVKRTEKILQKLFCTGTVFV